MANFMLARQDAAVCADERVRTLRAVHVRVARAVRPIELFRACAAQEAVNATSTGDPSRKLRKAYFRLTSSTQPFPISFVARVISFSALVDIIAVPSSPSPAWS